MITLSKNLIKDIKKLKTTKKVSITLKSEILKRAIARKKQPYQQLIYVPIILKDREYNIKQLLGGTNTYYKKHADGIYRSYKNLQEVYKDIGAIENYKTNYLCKNTTGQQVFIKVNASFYDVEIAKQEVANILNILYKKLEWLINRHQWFIECSLHMLSKYRNSLIAVHRQTETFDN